MLGSLRKTTGSLFVKLFLGVLIASFAIWGIGDIFRGGASQPLAKVGDDEVTQAGYMREFRAQMNQIQARAGGDFDTRKALSIGMDRTVLNQMVENLVWEQDARKKGLTVGEDSLRRAIEEIPAFHGIDGKFDRFRYEGILRNSGITEAGLLADLRRDLARDQLMSALAGGMSLPSFLVDTIYRYRNEQRVARILTVPASGMRSVSAPSADVLAAWYKLHDKDFTRPELRGFSWLLLELSSFADAKAVSEKEIADAYAQRGEDFSMPETRGVEQMLLPTQAAANTALAQVQRGEDFLKVAKEAAKLDSADARLGDLTRKQLEANLGKPAAEAVFATVQGGVTNPVQTPFGWHIFKVTAIKPGHETPLAEVHDKIAQDLAAERAADKMHNVANQIDDDIAGGKTISAIAEKYGLKLNHVDKVDARGRDSSGAPAPLPKAAKFLPTVFENAAGDEPELGETDDGGYFLVKVDNIIPAAVPPLSEAHDQAEAAWIREAQDKAASTLAVDILKKVEAGAALESFVAETRGAVTVSAPVKRESSDLTKDQVAQLFKLKPGGATVAVAADGNGAVVLQLVTIRPADPAQDAEGLNAVRSALRGDLAGDLSTQYYQSAMKGLSITRHDEMLDKLFAEDRAPAKP